MPADGSDEFEPLIIVTRGQAARIKRDGDDLESEWTPADFAWFFLWWVATEYPECAGRTITWPDIEDAFLPRFQASTGCHLQPGTLQRGLNEVTTKHEERFTDVTGSRRSRTVYDVPAPAAAVVDLAAERKRA